jgi:uncharacterized protein (UPF0261 family)
MSIVIVGMLDEREEALRIIKEQIERRGHETWLIDISIGTGGIIPSLKADVNPGEVVKAVEREVEEAGDGPQSEETMRAFLMREGLVKKVSALRKSGKLDGMIAITGMTGALISLPAMKALPFGVPKLLITTSAAMPAHAEQFADYFGLSDITVMHAVVDTVGMNSMVRKLAINGANAISGMAEAGGISRRGKKPSLAISEFGFCDKGAQHIRELLEGEYEIVSFHSNGLGDKAAFELVRQGNFKAFIDLVPGAYSEYLLGGNRPAGPNRLEAAKDLPIPYIFCPGGMDMISCGPLERRDKADPLWVSRKLAGRKLLVQDAMRVQARTSPEEMEEVAVAVADSLNRYRYKAKVRVLIPRKGFSSLSVDDGPLYDPAADAIFTDTLQEHLDPAIVFLTVDFDINSREFARAVADALAKAQSADV